MLWNSHKTLIYLLAALLALAPLPGALAQMSMPASESPASAMTHGDDHAGHMQHHDTGGEMSDHHAQSDCPKCKTDPNCDGHECSYGHCVLCVAIVMPADIEISAVSLEDITNFVVINHTNPFPIGLYRPPRS